MTDDAEVREAVAHRHGLGADAAAFLTGSTLDELDASAGLLAELVAEHRGPEPTTNTGPGTFADLIAAKRRRKQELAALFAGQPAQPRDDRGRFAATDYSRGARRPAPSPPESHDETLSRLFHTGEANAGRRL
jgi:hypothetical protein